LLQISVEFYFDNLLDVHNENNDNIVENIVDFLQENALLRD
jgi:hypothetical protein